MFKVLFISTSDGWLGWAWCCCLGDGVEEFFSMADTLVEEVTVRSTDPPGPPGDPVCFFRKSLSGQAALIGFCDEAFCKVKIKTI